MLQEFLYLLPCIVCLFWAVALGVQWKRNLRTQKIGVVVLGVCAINLFYWGFTDFPDYKVYSYFTILISFTHAGVYSLLWLAYQSLIDKRPFTRKDYLVFIPPLLIGMIYTLALFQMGVENYLALIAGYEDPKSQQPLISGLSSSLVHILSAFVNNLVAIIGITLLLITMTVRRIWYKDNRQAFFAQAENQSLPHSWALFYGVFALLFFILVILVGEFLYYIEDYIPFYVLFAVAACLFHYLGYHLYYLRR
ncbi:hypothetical protein [Parabacteroides sp. PF5-6]|uniref:hypothetical protein n=1 Tax=Parabacteroides sp. PF5-6 TaxID=1742403 RepID=UPI002406ED2D|nr:hypothetical protein [Parabacteroides sp. PF5-6]MDF9829851.1 hypothetical protein [Parabacteroides sp. PF5-6]